MAGAQPSALAAWTCPLTGQLFVEPVLYLAPNDGAAQIYERAALEQQLASLGITGDDRRPPRARGGRPVRRRGGGRFAAKRHPRRGKRGSAARSRRRRAPPCRRTTSGPCGASAPRRRRPATRSPRMARPCSSRACPRSCGTRRKVFWMRNKST